METWYRTGGFGDKLIEPVDVVKSTEKTVTIHETRWACIRERRQAIRSDRECYFRTWEEAQAHALSKAEWKVNLARRSLELANGQLGNVRGLKKPA